MIEINEIINRIKLCIGDNNGVDIYVHEPKQCVSNFWLINMRLLGENIGEFRDYIIMESHRSNIFLRPSWVLLNKLLMYKKVFTGHLSEANNQSKILIKIPSSHQLVN